MWYGTKQGMSLCVIRLLAHYMQRHSPATRCIRAAGVESHSPGMVYPSCLGVVVAVVGGASGSMMARRRIEALPGRWIRCFAPARGRPRHLKTLGCNQMRGNAAV
jgi:hypothetical protein